MLAIVSPVMVGAAAASPQPTAPASDSMRTKTFSACATVSPAICTGFVMGRRTAMASIVLIFTVFARVERAVPRGTGRRKQGIVAAGWAARQASVARPAAAIMAALDRRSVAIRLL